MARKHPQQVNFRCTTAQKEAYEALAEELGMPLAQIIRKQLGRLVRKQLGAEWLPGDEEE